MARRDPTFSEVVALIQRNEQAERSVGDVEQDLQRVLLMSRDAKLRDELVKFQAVRHIVTIWAASAAISVHRYCAGWGCVSHRHRCPLFLLLSTAQCSPDRSLQHMCAAALLAFSTQNECQLQIDAISGLPTLLRLLDAKDADLGVYAAATMWNLCKSPLLLLKLETTHSILKEQLARRLTDILVIALEPFHLAARPTGERGTTGIVESDSVENLNVLISCSISTQLTVVLHVENYTGHVRSLTDQFQLLSSGTRKQKAAALQEGTSVAYFDESGVLVARTCAVCSKAIKVTRKSARRNFLLCARDECGQTYHVKCSRWGRLDADDVHPDHFHCDRCARLHPLYYWDFIAEHAQHGELLSEHLFRSVAIARLEDAGDAMLFSRKQELLGVGKKRFRVPRSSKDDEMFVVAVQFIVAARYPSTFQVVSAPSAAPPSSSVANVTSSEALECDWHVSYASASAGDIEFRTGSAMFWPATFLVDLAPLCYTSRTLRELENAWVYELQGEQPVDKVFSFGASVADSGGADADASDKLRGLWAALYPRKGSCMKALAEQLGRVKQLGDLQSNAADDAASSSTAGAATTAPAAPGAKVSKSRTSRKPKPHFPGRKLNRVAVSTE